MASSSNFQSIDALGGEVNDIVARPYQLELLDAALDQDTIVNLGTGAGKTFIAVMLIKELSYDVLRPFSEKGAKRTFFLVTTVPLVRQQAEYISRHTSLCVGQYSGEMGVDRWLKHDWLLQLEQKQVLVMTMTIFKNLLLTGFLKLSQVNLVVFDECHHAVKNHDYVQIMRMFKKYIEDKNDAIPRRLGLTASLIPSKCKPGDIEKKIRELEETLICRSQTAEDLREVARYATNPGEKTCFFQSSSVNCNIAKLKSVLEDSVSFLELFKKEEKAGDIYDQVKLYLDDCLHILTNLGVWCANEFAFEGLHVLERSMNDIGGIYSSDWERGLLHLGWSQLKIFTDKSSTILEQNRHGIEDALLTHKAKCLLQFIRNSACLSENMMAETATVNKETHKLRGIVFVERRTTAVQLTKLIQQQSKMNADLRHIACDYVVGHGDARGGTHLRREAHMTTSKQDSILNRFRNGRINVLIATSIVEEGVDVPRCNSVIRFDFPPNFRSYIQSKGRARARVSQYILYIADGEEKGRRLNDLSDYHLLEKELQSICQGRGVPGEEDVLRRMEDFVEPYMPYGKDGAKALLGTSLAAVHRYCQKLPKDKFTILTPVFVTEKQSVQDVACLHRLVKDEAEEFVYKSSVQLPMNCPLKCSISGEWMPTRRIAEKSAALETIKCLHREGELNEHLLPISNRVDCSDDEAEPVAMEERKRKHVGTAKRSNYYPNKVAPVLKDCLPQNHRNNLYILMIHEQNKPLELYMAENGDPVQTTLGILTREPLPSAVIPEFSLYDGDKILCVKAEPYHNMVDLPNSELSILKDAHEVIFSELLHIRASWLHPNFENSLKKYLIVPLRVISCVYPVETYIDMEQAHSLAEMKAQSSFGNAASGTTWPRPIEDFKNALVKPIHSHEASDQLYLVLSIDPTTTPLSPFPDPKAAATYLEYYSKKYNFHLSDINQPALVVKRLGVGESRLKMLVSRFKNHEGQDLKRKEQASDIKLFPSLCSVYPISSKLWHIVRCLPSLLWRIECLLLVDTFRSKVASATGIGRSGESSLVLTHTNLRGYEDYGYGVLETQQISFNEEEVEVKLLTSLDFPGCVLRGPDNALLLQALTPKGAKDSVNLERLETLGDSFLKLSTSVFLYCDRPGDHEGKLTTARARRVENLNLYILAKQEDKDIASLVLSTAFEPRQMWIPPGFIFREMASDNTTGDSGCELHHSERDRHYNYHKATDKCVADCVESLIGAYLVSGGIEAGLRFMQWVGIKLTTNTKVTLAKSRHSLWDSLEGGNVTSTYCTPPMSKRPKMAGIGSLFVLNSSSIFKDYFGLPEQPELSEQQCLELERLLRKCSACQVSKRLKWDFKKRYLLVQALTHASYTRNRVTDYYQRLEFLGDAVLDYLVTCHIYSTFPKYGPGEISNMRSALVNNVTFAELSVKLQLHKSLLHNSPSLFKQIEDYIRILDCNEKNDKPLEELYCHSQESLKEGADNVCVDADVEVTSEDIDIDELDPPKVLGDILESVTGAVFLDSGMSLESVWSVFCPLFEEKIASFNGVVPVPPLQELLERAPSAKVIYDHERRRSGRFRCSITVLDKGIKIIAEANNPKNVRVAAARAALRKLNSQC